MPYIREDRDFRAGGTGGHGDFVYYISKYIINYLYNAKSCHLIINLKNIIDEEICNQKETCCKNRKETKRTIKNNTPPYTLYFYLLLHFNAR